MEKFVIVSCMGRRHPQNSSKSSEHRSGLHGVGINRVMWESDVNLKMDLKRSDDAWESTAIREKSGAVLMKRVKVLKERLGTSA